MNESPLYANGFTKRDAIAYYKAISRVLLPHLRKRPVSFKRFADSVHGEAFWEKDAPSFTPAWVKRFPVPRREGGPPIEYILIDNVRTLLWVASVGGVEIHPFLHVVPQITIATHVVFDLDPGDDAGLRECARVALILREALQGLALESLAKVSGGKGIQVYVPLNQTRRGPTHEATETFARLIAGELARRYPKLIVAKMTKALRRGKVFIDWSQNADYKTTVAVYSLRAQRDEPFVSTPVTWEELSKSRADLAFSPDEALARVRKRGDLFAPVLRLKQKLPGFAAAADPQPRARPKPTRTSTLPKTKSQSGRRLFLVTKTEMGNELWMDWQGQFKRWILRPDREGGEQLIAMPAGEFPIDPDYARAIVPKEWKGRVTIEDSGAYEVIEGSFARKHLALWFNGRILGGRWTLEKVTAEDHRSWRLVPER
jgi:bifunctional non-homologous end joining protein LigD